MLEVGVILLAALAIAGVPVTAVVVMRETRRIFASFTEHLDTRPVVVGGETENIASQRLDLEAAKLDLKRDEIEAQREASERNFAARATRLRSVGGADKIETA